jgi:hypothetical protein
MRLVSFDFRFRENVTFCGLRSTTAPVCQAQPGCMAGAGMPPVQDHGIEGAEAVLFADG